MKKEPKEIKSVRLSQETLNQYEKYANFIEKLIGTKPSLSRTADEALLFFTYYRLLAMANEMAKAIQSTSESNVENQKNKEA